MTTRTPIPSILAPCSYTFRDGHRCGSPALRNEDFCYYHHPSRRPVSDSQHRARRARSIARRSFRLPAPQNRQQLQAALSVLLHGIAADEIDNRRAGLLLSALQALSQTLPG